MQYCEFQDIFKSNHVKLVNNLLSFFEVDIETLNEMIKRSYIVIAGGYARRLYMVANNIEMTNEDMLAYFTSDVDLFSLSSYFDENNKKDNKEDDTFFGVTSSRTQCLVDEVDDFTLIVHQSPHQETVSKLKFKRLKNKMKSLNINRKDRPYMFYKGDLIMTSAFNSCNLFSIRSVSQWNEDIPYIQYINVGKKKLMTTMTTQLVKSSYDPAHRLVSTFDLSQTKFFVEKIDLSSDNCVVNTQYTNTPNLYHCDIEDYKKESIGVVSRILKYAGIGMKFEESQIKDLLPSGVSKQEDIIIEGGYY